MVNEEGSNGKNNEDVNSLKVEIDKLSRDIKNLNNRLKKLEGDKLGYLERLGEVISKNFLILRVGFILILIIDAILLIQQISIPNYWQSFSWAVIGAFTGTEGYKKVNE